MMLGKEKKTHTPTPTHQPTLFSDSWQPENDDNPIWPKVDLSTSCTHVFIFIWYHKLVSFVFIIGCEGKYPSSLYGGKKHETSVIATTLVVYPT